MYDEKGDFIRKDIEKSITFGLMTYRFAFIMAIIGIYTVIFEIPTWIFYIFQEMSPGGSSEFNE